METKLKALVRKLADIHAKVLLCSVCDLDVVVVVAVVFAVAVAAVGTANRSSNLTMPAIRFTLSLRVTTPLFTAPTPPTHAMWPVCVPGPPLPVTGPHVEEPCLLAVQLLPGLAEAHAAQEGVPVSHPDRQHDEEAAHRCALGAYSSVFQ